MSSKPIFLLLAGLLISGSAMARVQVSILRCQSENIDQTELYKVIQNTDDSGRVTYLLVQTMPYAPYQRQVWLSSTPKITTKSGKNPIASVEVHEKTTAGHADIYPVKNSDRGEWVIDINLAGIVTKTTQGYLCDFYDPMHPQPWPY